MKISSKLNELKPTDLNCNVFDVYSYDGLSMQDLLCQFFTKINECIKISNETIDLASWLVNEGLKKEVVEKLMLWLNDGTLENLINVNLFNTLHTKIENINTQLAHIENNINTTFINIESMERLDGETDDTGRIKRALEISRHIYLPKTYVISEPIKLRGGECIFGNGVMSKITCVGCHSAFINAYKERQEIITQVVIRDLLIASDNSDYGLDLTQVAYSIFENLTISGFNIDGVYNSIITMNASYNTFLNCIFKRNKQ